MPGNIREIKKYDWRGDLRSVHIQVTNLREEIANIYVRRRNLTETDANWQMIALSPRESYRFILSKSATGEAGVDIALPETVESTLYEVFDRAHFPTLAVEEIGKSPTDVSPQAFALLKRTREVKPN